MQKAKVKIFRYVKERLILSRIPLVNVPVGIRIPLECIVDDIIAISHHILGIAAGKLAIVGTIIILETLPIKLI